MAAARARRAFRTRLRVPEGRDPGLFWRAVNRLSAVHGVACWRARNGEVPDTAGIRRYVEITADALRHADGGGRRYAFDAPAIRENWLPREWHDAIDDDDIYVVIRDVERTRTPDDLMTSREVSRLLRLHLAEIEAMRTGGTNVQFPAVDLSPAEHEARLLERKRAGARERSRRYRATKNIANPRHAAPCKGDRDADCKVPATQEAAVCAAIVGGAAKVADIARVTGLPATTVRPVLSRLTKAGAVTRTGRGVYAAVSLAQVDEAGRVAAAGTVHSGPSVTPSQPEPPVEMERDAPALHPVADAGRALEAREPVAGPERAISLALSAPLHPRRAAPSRLPSTVFNLAAWRIHNAPARVA